MRNKVLYTILLLSFVQAGSYAQKRGSAKAESYFKIAEKEYADQRYMYAVPFFKTALKRGVAKDSLGMLHLAESYWQVKSYDSARLYYRKFEAKYGSPFFVAQRLGELAAVKQDYADAVKIYQKIQQDHAGVSTALVSQRVQGFTNLNIFLRDSSQYQLRLLKLNSRQQDFSPQYYRDGMVFVSNRYARLHKEKEFGWDGLPYADIYWVKDTSACETTDTMPARTEYVFNKALKANDDYTARTSNDNNVILVSNVKGQYAGGEINKLDKFTDELDAKYNYGPLCFNNSSNKVYFTRNTLKPYKGRYNLEICVATLVTGGAWGPIKVMPFVEMEYDFYHPALSADESRLYFCSNRPGGKGGSDIYYVNMSSDSAMQTPVLLDDKVNTTGDELFPTIHGDTLYFSSNGWAGIGGLDLYRTTLKNGSFTTPVNLGYPLNSQYDDFGIVFNNKKREGFVTSNRLGTDDIYHFKELDLRIQLTGLVLDKSTMRRLSVAKVVIREVIDSVLSKDSVVTGMTGNFTFPLKPNHTYQLTFTKEGYTSDSASIARITVVKDIELAPALLSPIIVPKPAPVIADKDEDGVEDKKDKCPTKKGNADNFGCPDIQARLNELAKMVFFKTASAELLPAAFKPLNEAVEILNEYPNTTLAIEGHTDSRASAPYNKDLSQRRAASVKKFFMDRGLKANRFTSVVGYGLERPIATNATEEGRQMNRRVSIKATFIY